MTDCVIISRWYCVKYLASIELLILCKADILSRKLSVHASTHICIISGVVLIQLETQFVGRPTLP